MLPSFDPNFNTTINSNDEDHGTGIECLCCYKHFAHKTTIYNDNKIRVEILSDLFSTFSKYIKWDSPREYQFDFMEEQFPFCSSCSHSLVRVFKLDEQLREIISDIISTILNCEKQSLKKNRDGASEKMEFYRRQTILQHQPEPVVKNVIRAEPEKEHYFHGQCSNARGEYKVLVPAIRSKSSSPERLSTAVPQAKLSKFAAVQRLGRSKFIYDNKYLFTRSKDGWQCLACDESHATKFDLLLHWETRPCFSSDQSIDIVETFPSYDDTPQNNTDQEPHEFKHQKLSTPSQKKTQPGIVCSLCGASFKTKQSRQRHILTIHVDESCKTFACQICARKFVSSSLLNEHMSGHKKKPCPVCGKICQASAMSTHKKRHKLSPKGYKCKFCHQSFPLMHRLTTHLKSCENASAGSSKNPGRDPNKGSSANPQITCQFCRTTFSHKRSLCVHIQKLHTPDQDKTFQCRVCKKKFASKNILKVHFKVHEKVECDICNEIYSVNSIYSHKYFVHKSVDCTVCNKNFKLDAFQEHVNWHKEQDPGGRTPASHYPRKRTKVARPPRRQQLTKSAAN